MGRACQYCDAGNMKPYKYRVRRIAAPEYNKGGSLIRAGNQEVLSGFINGEPASDLEERVARSLTKLEIPFDFRVRITSQAVGQQRLTSQRANIHGEVEVDHLCNQGGVITPIMVDGGISHFYAAWQADEDKQKTNIVNEFGARLGWRPTVRIPFWKLIDQDMADRTIREVLNA
jgi:hypothetical protein